METTAKKRTGLYWILTIISVAAFFWLMYTPAASYVSMVLPFSCTWLAKALDLM